MAKLNIIRASAGSGKTYSLTREILKILLSEPVSYFKRILAVTFTNKATAEMKGRILQELYLLASGKPSSHLNALKESSNKKEESVRGKARAILFNILHNYSWFRIETIDTFFQGIIRSFVREMGIAGNYTVELDQEKILSEAIDRLLDNIDDDHEMLNWILEYIDSKLSEGKSWAISDELLSLGKSLFQESLIANLPLISERLEQNDFLKTYRDTLIQIVKSYENKLLLHADKALSAMETAGLGPNDFSYGKTGPAGYFMKIKNGMFEPAGANVHKVLNSGGKWASAKCSRKEEANTLGNNVLGKELTAIIDIISGEGVEYNTSQAILKNVHVLGLLSKLNREIGNIREDKGVFLISDSAPFIQKIINNNDAPFIYEKAGNHFNHILIDEFQDTSNMQWGNFKPLISNSLSNSNNCLIVGDVKQSIYRWRNSNWEILEKRVKEEFLEEVLNERNLTVNWRSDKNIIEFNNTFFKESARILDNHLIDSTEQTILPGSIYNDVSQNNPPGKQNEFGYINIKLYQKSEKAEDDEYFAAEIIVRINEVLSMGYLPGDIAMLVRNKKEGSILANFLVEANKDKCFSSEVGVISNESLFLNHSPIVQLLVSAMKYVNDPSDELAMAELTANYLHATSKKEETEIRFSSETFIPENLEHLMGEEFIEKCKGLRQESLYLISEEIVTLLELNNFNDELVYLHSFLDLLFEYSINEHADLNHFLSYWEEDGQGKTISAVETPGAIRILTIHKSKGLQFPIVIIPFASWGIVPKSNEKIWLNPGEPPYDMLPFLPVNYTKKLEDSHFKIQYNTENYLSLIDNLNLMYVAFTRAENALFACVVDESKELVSTGRLIVATLKNIYAGNKTFNLSFEEENNRYRTGKLVRRPSAENQKLSKTLTPGNTSVNMPEVRISKRASEFMAKEGPVRADAVTYGRILHSIMEKCYTIDDVPVIIKQKVEEGILTVEEGVEIQGFLLNAMSSELTKDWFTDKYVVLTEADIISPGGRIKRPDRVMIEGNTAIVVDYKFGQEDEFDIYKRQVREYMRLIKDTGMETVVGYLWYLAKEELVTVKP